MTNLTKQAKEIFENVEGFIKNNNYKIVSVKENYCELVGTLTETSMNTYNIAHGGYIFGLADTAAGIAAMTDGRKAVTVDSNISFLKQGKTDSLTAIANSIKVGKTISVFEVKVYNDQKELIAVSTITYFYITK